MPESRDPLFVFGASGHGKVVIDVARRLGHPVHRVLDDDAARHGGILLGVPVTGGRECLAGHAGCGFVAIGNNALRLAVADWLQQQGIACIALVDPAAVVSASATVGAGSLVMPGAVVNADAVIGEQVIVNTGASVDHDCVIGDGVHIAPGCRVCGNVQVGRGVFLGAGSVVIPGVHIGAGAVVGAGSTVLEDIPAGARAAGSPCRLLEGRP